jgi:hypothetical protein
MAQDFKIQSDQPRAQAKDIARGNPSPSIEYRVSSIRTLGNRAAPRANARSERR